MYNLLKGEALPSCNTTDNGSTNSSAVNVVSTTDREASCGQVTNVIVQGGGNGVAGPPGPVHHGTNWTSRTSRYIAIAN